MQRRLLLVRKAGLFALAALVLIGGCEQSTIVQVDLPEEEGPYVARKVRDVSWNVDLTRIDVTYETSGCTGGEGDTCDIDAVTLICKPGRDGTVRRCDVSN